jgi:ATP adenylyltransferase
MWAPWRIPYIRSLGGGDEGCFLCRHRDHPAKDAENLVLWRGAHCMALMNRFPYTGGHMLVAPFEHAGELSDFGPAVMVEIMEMVRDLQTVLRRTVHPHGFNVGINVGRCAGAGLPDHLHVHLVPRWSGDTNFMPVFDNVRVIPQALEELYEEMRRAGEELDLPKLSGAHD